MRSSRTGWQGSAGAAAQNGRCFGGWEVSGIGANYGARIDAISEGANDAEHFVVSPARVCSGLHDEVRQFVDGISGGIESVVQTAAGAGSKFKEILESCGHAAGISRRVRAEAATAESGLGIF